VIKKEVEFMEPEEEGEMSPVKEVE